MCGCSTASPPRRRGKSSVAGELVATLQRQLDLTRARVSEGAMPPLDRDLLEVEVRRLQAERVRAAGRAEVAILQLKQLLGLILLRRCCCARRLDALVGRTGAPAAPAGVPSATRPDVSQAESRLTLAGARVDEARREGRLDVSLFGSYMRMDAGFPQMGVGPSGVLERVRGQFNYVAAGAMIVLPLFNRNQGEVARAEAERSGAAARLEATTLAAARKSRSHGRVTRERRKRSRCSSARPKASRGRISTSSARPSILAAQPFSTFWPNNAGTWISSRPIRRPCARPGKRAPR